jgi:hypothetical protein
VTFAKKPSRSPSRRLLRASRYSTTGALRTVFFGVLAIAGAAWALARHYTHTLPPLRVPFVPAAAPTYDADAGETPVPDTLAPD